MDAIDGSSTLYLAPHLCILVRQRDRVNDPAVAAQLKAIEPSVETTMTVHPTKPRTVRTVNRAVGLMSLLSAALGALSVMQYALFSQANLFGGCIIDGRDDSGLKLRVVVLSILLADTVGILVLLSWACADAVGLRGLWQFFRWEMSRNVNGVLGLLGLCVAWIASIVLAGPDTPLLAVVVILVFAISTPMIDLFYLIEERDVGVVAPHALGVTCSSVLMYLSDIILPCLTERQSSQNMGSRATIAVFHVFLAFQVVRVVQYTVLKMMPSTCHIPPWVAFDRGVFCQLHRRSTSRACELYYSPHFMHVVPKSHSEMRDAIVHDSGFGDVCRAEIKPKFGGARMATSLAVLSVLSLAATLVKTALDFADTRVGSIDPQTGNITVGGVTMRGRAMPIEYYEYYRAIKAKPVSCLGLAGNLRLPGVIHAAISATGYVTFVLILLLITGNLLLAFKDRRDFLRVYLFQLRQAPIFVLLSLGLFSSSVSELALNFRAEDARFSLIAAPFALWAIPVSELFHITGHRTRATTAPVILCILLYFVREAFASVCSCAVSAEATIIATFVVRLRRVLLRLWIASIVKFVLPKLMSRSRDVPQSIKFDASRQCQRGLRDGFVQVPYSTICADTSEASFFTEDVLDAGADEWPGREGPGDTGQEDTGPGDTGPGDMGPGDMGPGVMGPGKVGAGATRRLWEMAAVGIPPLVALDAQSEAGRSANGDSDDRDSRDNRIDVTIGSVRAEALAATEVVTSDSVRAERTGAGRSLFSIRTIIVAPVALFLLMTMLSTFVVFVVSNEAIVGSTSVQLSAQMSSQVTGLVSEYFRGPHVALGMMELAYSRGGLPFDGSDPFTQRSSEEYLFDVVEKIQGAIYLNLAIDASGHFLGCECVPEQGVSRLHVRNATFAPARWSFNGSSMPFGRPSTMVYREPYTVNIDYNVHKRPWYSAVVSGSQSPHQSVWSDPYMFTDGTRIGILLGTAVRDKTGRVVAVLGVDSVVSDIIQTLTNIAKGITRASAEVYVLDGTGYIIAGTSDPARASNTSSSAPAFVHVRDSQELVVRRAALAPEFQRALRTGTDAHFPVQWFRAASIAASLRFFPEDTAPAGWSVLVITRQDGLQRGALKTAQGTVLVLGLFFLVAIFVTDHLAHKISRPIVAIAENLAEAGPQSVVQTSVAEIQHLSRRATIVAGAYSRQQQQQQAAGSSGLNEI